jgi:hypothetical protein
MFGYTPEYWTKRAEEMRSLGSMMKDPGTRREMEAIARGYESLARHAAKKNAATQALAVTQPEKQA